MTRPNVLHFTTTGAIAGTEQAVLDLSEAHDFSKWNVSFGTLLPPGEMNRKIEANEAVCYSTNLTRGAAAPLAVVRLAKLLRRHKIDVLHTHLLHAGYAGLLAARLAGRSRIRLVHTRHHSDELHRFGSKWRPRMDGLVARNQDLVCANSLAATAVLRDLERVDPGKIRLTYPGVHLTRLRSRVSDISGAEVRRELGVSDGDLMIGSIAHLLPKKGHRILLQAMCRVTQACPTAKLVIVGRGPERERLEAQTSSLGLASSVKFLGYRDDVPNLINAMDLLVQPSIEEAFGLSMVEGMALGKPVVASRVGGIPEVVVDGGTGLLVPPGDANALADALIAMLTDRSQRESFGSAGRARAEEKFTIPRLAADYEAVWAEALSRDK